MSSGLLIADELVEGTDWIRRDPSAWWAPRERGTRARAYTTDMLVGHWTAGHARTVEAGPRVVRSMKARRRPDGTPLVVGIHFVIGWDGKVWQTADLTTATVHVGRGPTNARSVGVECCWPGTARQADRLGVPGNVERVTVTVAGRPVDVLLPSPALLAAWVRLAETLAALDGRGGVRIPRRVPEPLTGRLSGAQARRWQGALEHLHVPGTTKIDAAGLLVGALLDAGWEAVRP